LFAVQAQGFTELSIKYPTFNFDTVQDISGHFEIPQGALALLHANGYCIVFKGALIPHQSTGSVQGVAMKLLGVIQMLPRKFRVKAIKVLVISASFCPSELSFNRAFDEK
jgi:hypothetical protein